MAEARIPVDLRNPGQVFACLGLMEAAEILFAGAEVTGGYCWEAGATQAQFRLDVTDVADPVLEILRFLQGAEAVALAPNGSELRDKKAYINTTEHDAGFFPVNPDIKDSVLPVLLTGNNIHCIPISYWAEEYCFWRPDLAIWSANGGHSGAARAYDCLKLIRQETKGNRIAQACENPFRISGEQSSAFRLDLRRDYTARDLGFSPNKHGAMVMQGYPLVELLAAIGLEHARPIRIDRFRFQYAVSNTLLPTTLARAVLGAPQLLFSTRSFLAKIDWTTDQEKERCIINAIEVSNQEDDRR
jgi:CRISPR-associated protein Csb3